MFDDKKYKNYSHISVTYLVLANLKSLSAVAARVVHEAACRAAYAAFPADIPKILERLFHFSASFKKYLTVHCISYSRITVSSSQRRRWARARSQCIR